MYTSCGFQSKLQVQSSLARAVTVDSEVPPKSRTLHTLNVVANTKTGMKHIFNFFVIFFTLTSCCLRTSTQTKICDCCNITYSSIDSAMNCILKNPITQSSAVNRLFLIAFVRKDEVPYQKIGWNILKDKDIINIAKQNYLLIILNVAEIQNSHVQHPSELYEIINRHNEELFFVITNQVLYPFSDWTERENKNTIIDKLQVGNGP